MNPILLLALAGGAVYLTSINKTGKQLTVTILNIHSFKVNAGSVQLALSIALDNPTNTKLKIKKPNVKVFYNQNEVGNTLPSADKVEIAANTRTKLDPITISIPLMNLPSLAMQLFTKVGTEKISFDFEVSTDVNGIPISQRKTLTI